MRGATRPGWALSCLCCAVLDMGSTVLRTNRSRQVDKTTDEIGPSDWASEGMGMSLQPRVVRDGT